MIRKSLIFLVFAMFFAGCAVNNKYDYTQFIQANPKSILVLMPTNQTTEIKGSAAVAANSIFPLSEAGYYVFPMSLVNDTFRHNGLTDPAEIANVPISKLRQYFNPDAILYLNILQYGTTFQLINSKTAVSVEAKLVDAKSENVIWSNTATAQKDSGGGSGGLLGMVLSAVVNQIVDSVRDAGFEMSAQATSMLYSHDCNNCLLRGPRSLKFREDLQLK